MSELVPVLEAVCAELEAGRPCVLCAVVKTRGSAPQGPGAALVVRDGQSCAGTLGGGCVEAEVIRQASSGLLLQGGSACRDFRLNSDYGWDDGLICGGSMRIAMRALEPGAGAAPFRQALEAYHAGRPASFAIRVARGEGGEEEKEYRIHLEAPAPLLIAGAGHVGQALADLAVRLDFAVTVFDDRADCAAPSRFPPGVRLVVDDIAEALRAHPIGERDSVVIVTRGHKHDEAALEAVIHAPARYIGLIGSKRKRTLIFDDLRKFGVEEALLARVHSPVGLDIGAVTVPEIAVSIAAQLIQVRRATPFQAVEGPFPAPAAAGAPDAAGP